MHNTHMARLGFNGYLRVGCVAVWGPHGHCLSWVGKGCLYMLREHHSRTVLVGGDWDGNGHGGRVGSE